MPTYLPISALPAITGTLATVVGINNSSAAQLASSTALKTLLSIPVGGIQPLDDDLTAIAAIVWNANTAPYATGPGAWAAMSITPFARTVLDDSNAAAALTTLGVPTAISNYLSGLTLSNNGSDAVNDIDVAPGTCMDSTNTSIMTLSATITKRLDAAWAVGSGNGGLDTGSIANTTYHLYVIKRLDTGVTDVIYSASASAPTLPANYSVYRRIHSIIRLGGTILAFRQAGDRMTLDIPISDVSATNPGTAAVTRTITVPTGIVIFPSISWWVNNSTTANIGVLISSLAITDTAPGTAPPHSFRTTAVGAGGGALLENVATNTSAQVRSRLSASGASDILYGTTHGWVDTRGT